GDDMERIVLMGECNQCRHRVPQLLRQLMDYIGHDRTRRCYLTNGSTRSLTSRQALMTFTSPESFSFSVRMFSIINLAKSPNAITRTSSFSEKLLPGDTFASGLATRLSSGVAFGFGLIIGCLRALLSLPTRF